jgi:hypothetical protein
MKFSIGHSHFDIHPSAIILVGIVIIAVAAVLWFTLPRSN